MARFGSTRRARLVVAGADAVAVAALGAGRAVPADAAPSTQGAAPAGSALSSALSSAVSAAGLDAARHRRATVRLVVLAAGGPDGVRAATRAARAAGARVVAVEDLVGPARRPIGQGRRSHVGPGVLPDHARELVGLALVQPCGGGAQPIGRSAPERAVAATLHRPPHLPNPASLLLVLDRRST